MRNFYADRNRNRWNLCDCASDLIVIHERGGTDETTEVSSDERTRNQLLSCCSILVLKSQEYGSDLYAQHNIELLDDAQHSGT
jgi:hypothetical protein